jgi:hypothetical protein
MKLIKNENQEFTNEVKDALRYYADSTNCNLSKSEIDNAWIRFSNTLDFVEKSKPVVKATPKYSFLNYRTFSPLFAGMATAVVLFYFIIQNSNQTIDNKVLVQSNVNSMNVTLAKSSKEYVLPKPEKFSELVRYVKEDRHKETAEVVYPKSYREFGNDLYARRVSAEFEQSLRDSFSSESLKWNEVEPIETTLSSNLISADIVDSHNIMFVSR